MISKIWKSTVCLLLCATLGSLTLSAQNDLSSLMLVNTWQNMNANPALQPSGFTINLPGIYNNLWVTNITFNDLLVEEGGRQVLDVSNAISQMEAQNILREDLDIETIGIGFQFGALGLNIGHRLRFNALIDYPKTLAQLIWEGNAQFIGQTVEFGPAFDVTAYHEFALGASYKIGDNIKVGGRVKLLSGGANLNTGNSELQLTTDDDIYQLRMDADYVVNSAGTLNYDGLRDVNVNFDFGNFSTDELFGGNSGMAFDLGIAVKLNRLQIAVSAVDLGGEISWEENVNNYTLEGAYEFEGLDVAQDLLDNEESFGSIIDSLYDTYEPIETSQSYTTTIGAKYYFSGQYEIDEQISVGLIGFTNDYRDINTTGLAVTGSINFSPLLRLGAFYGLRNERFDNLGVNATVSIGPARIILATDNIISAFRPKDANLANFRLGANLQFGQEKEDVDTSNGNRFF
ncbi:MAG: DUF5723 family protein [Bacteroidota bacterium]